MVASPRPEALEAKRSEWHQSGTRAEYEEDWLPVASCVCPRLFDSGAHCVVRLEGMS
jgi:hypothetical protein